VRGVVVVMLMQRLGGGTREIWAAAAAEQLQQHWCRGVAVAHFGVVTLAAGCFKYRYEWIASTSQHCRGCICTQPLLLPTLTRKFVLKTKRNSCCPVAALLLLAGGIKRGALTGPGVTAARKRLACE
jgi:hypothetical protein